MSRFMHVEGIAIACTNMLNHDDGCLHWDYKCNQSDCPMEHDITCCYGTCQVYNHTGVQTTS